MPIAIHTSSDECATATLLEQVPREPVSLAVIDSPGYFGAVICSVLRGAGGVSEHETTFIILKSLTICRRICRGRDTAAGVTAARATTDPPGPFETLFGALDTWFDALLATTARNPWDTASHIAAKALCKVGMVQCHCLRWCSCASVRRVFRVIVLRARLQQEDVVVEALYLLGAPLSFRSKALIQHRYLSAGRRR